MKKRRIDLTDCEVDNHCCSIDCIKDNCILSSPQDVFGAACLGKYQKSLWYKNFNQDWLNEEIEIQEGNK